LNETCARGYQPTVSVPRATHGVPFLLVGQVSGRENESLLARLRAGEVSALGEAFDAHHAHVRAFARRITGDDSAAEDLVQETFLALPRAIARFRGESSVRTLLVSIAVNHARNHVRAAARRREALARLACEVKTPSSTPAEDVERAQLAGALIRALDSLPIDQRVTVVLCEVEERTSAEVAVITGVPEGTVRSRLHHARRKLLEALAKEGVR
jgi:RNA polymerase sigma-70 factor (ECF subfamily)